MASDSDLKHVIHKVHIYFLINVKEGEISRSNVSPFLCDEKILFKLISRRKKKFEQTFFILEGKKITTRGITRYVFRIFEPLVKKSFIVTSPSSYFRTLKKKRKENRRFPKMVAGNFFGGWFFENRRGQCGNAFEEKGRLWERRESR